jgi:hypothetical protein
MAAFGSNSTYPERRLWRRKAAISQCTLEIIGKPDLAPENQLEA